MKLAAVAPLLALPGTLGLAIRDHTAQITFTGAADAQFTQDFPADGSIVKISKLPYTTCFYLCKTSLSLTIKQPTP